MRRNAERGLGFLNSKRLDSHLWPSGVGETDPDLSVTMWASLAKMSGTDFRVHKTDDADRKTAEALSALVDPKTGRLRRDHGVRRAGEADERTPGLHGLAATATATLARFALTRSDAEQTEDPTSLRILVDQPPFAPGNEVHDPEGWFCAAQSVNLLDPERWSEWSSCMDALIESQQENGSWAPHGSIAKQMGSDYATALCVLTLQTHYRLTAK